MLPHVWGLFVVISAFIARCGQGDGGGALQEQMRLYLAGKTEVLRLAVARFAPQGARLDELQHSLEMAQKSLATLQESLSTVRGSLEDVQVTVHGLQLLIPAWIHEEFLKMSRTLAAEVTRALFELRHQVAEVAGSALSSARTDIVHYYRTSLVVSVDSSSASHASAIIPYGLTIPLHRFYVITPTGQILAASTVMAILSFVIFVDRFFFRKRTTPAIDTRSLSPPSSPRPDTLPPVSIAHPPDSNTLAGRDITADDGETDADMAPGSYSLGDTNNDNIVEGDSTDTTDVSPPAPRTDGCPLAPGPQTTTIESRGYVAATKLDPEDFGSTMTATIAVLDIPAPNLDAPLVVNTQTDDGSETVCNADAVASSSGLRLVADPPTNDEATQAVQCSDAVAPMATSEASVANEAAVHDAPIVTFPAEDATVLPEWVMAWRRSPAHNNPELCLTFRRGQIIRVLAGKPGGRWWVGEVEDGTRGHFPPTYVDVLVEPQTNAAPPVPVIVVRPPTPDCAVDSIAQPGRQVLRDIRNDI